MPRIFLVVCFMVFSLFMIPASAEARFCGRINDPWSEYTSGKIEVHAYRMPCSVAKRWARITVNRPCSSWVGPWHSLPPKPPLEDICDTWQTWHRHDKYHPRWKFRTAGGSSVYRSDEDDD